MRQPVRKLLQEFSEEDEVETRQKTKKKKLRTQDINSRNKEILQSEYSEEECDFMSIHSEEEAGYDDDSEDQQFEIS